MFLYAHTCVCSILGVYLPSSTVSGTLSVNILMNLYPQFNYPMMMAYIRTHCSVHFQGLIKAHVSTSVVVHGLVS